MIAGPDQEQSKERIEAIEEGHYEELDDFDPAVS